MSIQSDNYNEGILLSINESIDYCNLSSSPFGERLHEGHPCGGLFPCKSLGRDFKGEGGCSENKSLVCDDSISSH